MRRIALLPLIGVALAACNSDSTTRPNPTNLRGPQLQTSTIDPVNAPSGTHLQTGTIGCTPPPGSGLTVTCSSFELAGVGHTNAAVSLVAHYTADVECSNKGVNPQNSVEAQGQSFTASDNFVATSSKNGRLTVRSASASPGGLDQNPCPNGNWTATLTNLTLVSYTYSVTFDGFTRPYILIAGP